jgi:hypothetical protein
VHWLNRPLIQADEILKRCHALLKSPKAPEPSQRNGSRK